MNTSYFISFITAVFIGGTAGYVGSLMATKKMSLVGDVLSHIALPGIGLGLLYGVNVSLGALIASFGNYAYLVVEFENGAFYGISGGRCFRVKFGGWLPSHSRGGIIACSFWKYFCRRLSGCDCYRICKHNCFYSYQNDLFKNDASLCVRGFGVTGGVKINKYNLIYLFLIAGVVAFGIKVGGTLLTSAMIIIPAAVARNVSRNMRQYSWLSIIVGATSAIAGFAVFPFLAERFNLSAVTI